MPVTGPSSYLPTIGEFIAHWTNVNASLGASPLKLNGNYTLANFITDRATLATKITNATSLGDTARGSGGTRDTARAGVKERMRQFNQLVRGKVLSATYVEMLPGMPQITAAQGPWTTAMDKMVNCWTAINLDDSIPGFPTPLSLNGPYTLANFQSDRTALISAFTGYTTSTENFEGGVAGRDAFYKTMETRMVQYRRAVEGSFTEPNAFISTIPALSPAPGTTPPATSLTAVWQASDNKAHLLWDAATDPKITGYQVRGCFGGTKYVTSDEDVIATIALGTTHYETAIGLAASGSVAFFKVYTLTATGNEKGSNAVKVVRP